MFLAFGVRFLRYSVRAGSVSDGQIRQRTNEGALRAGSVSDGQISQRTNEGALRAVEREPRDTKYFAKGKTASVRRKRPTLACSLFVRH